MGGASNKWPRGGRKRDTIVLGAVVSDFLVSAIIGGGLAIYLSLRQDKVGEYANSFGKAQVSICKSYDHISVTNAFEFPDDHVSWESWY